MSHREVMKQALLALKNNAGEARIEGAINILEAALAEPQAEEIEALKNELAFWEKYVDHIHDKISAPQRQPQEPVSFYVYERGNSHDGTVFRSFRPDEHQMGRAPDRTIPVPAPQRQPQDDPVAWMHPDDGRVIPAATMKIAVQDGGASLSSVRGYTIPLGPLRQPHEPQQPVAIVEAVVPHLASIVVKHILGAPFPKVGDFFYVASQRQPQEPQQPVACNTLFNDFLAAAKEAGVTHLSQEVIEALKAAQGVLFWTELAHQPPVRETFETGRMVRVRLHALADLHGALTALAAAPARPTPQRQPQDGGQDGQG